MEEITKTVPRMMSVRQVAATEILPENALRQMVKAGKAPGCYCGTKFMFNFDRLIDQLNGEAVKTQ